MTTLPASELRPTKVAEHGSLRVAVHGLGYVGATQAGCLAALGHDVIAVDIDPDRVAALSRGHLPFYEPGLEDLLRKGVADGRLTFSNATADTIRAEVHFLCVGTPQRSDDAGADLSALRAVIDELADTIDRPALVVGKSTVPVGTAAALRSCLRERAGASVDLAWNPEFLREGMGVRDTLQPDRLVFGVAEPTAARLLRQVYRPLIEAGVPVVETDLATAELAKESANALLAARLSLTNVLAELCEASGADVRDLVRIVGLDHRIGAKYLKPGVGFGGSCLPKDLRALVARGRELGVGRSLELFEHVDAVNDRQRERITDRADAWVAPRSRIAVLGAAFKGGSDDVRESPALAIAAALHDRRHQVVVFDPLALGPARRAMPQLTYAETIDAACRDADLVLILTDSPEYARLDPAALARLVRSPKVIDGRMMLDQVGWVTAGWQVQVPGSGSATGEPAS